MIRTSTFDDFFTATAPLRCPASPYTSPGWRRGKSRLPDLTRAEGPRWLTATSASQTTLGIGFDFLRAQWRSEHCVDSERTKHKRHWLRQLANVSSPWRSVPIEHRPGALAQLDVTWRCATPA